MAWWENLKNIIAPKPASQVVTISYAPRLAVGALLTGGAAATYGNLVALLADGDNTSDCWVEGLVLAAPNTATTSYSVCLSREADGGAPAKIEAEVPLLTETTVVGDTHEYIKLDPPIYFPSGTGIRAACADVAVGGKTIRVWAVISRGRSSV